MTISINKRGILFTILMVVFLASIPFRGASQNRIASTVSPSMMVRLLGFKDIKPDDLHNLEKLYESTGWKILKMDDDPSDGEMAVWGGRNMTLSMDEFETDGTEKPNNGIYIHITKLEGFVVDFIKIVFTDEGERDLFAAGLRRYGIFCDDTSEGTCSGNITLKNGDNIGLNCEFGFESMLPKVEISINR